MIVKVVTKPKNKIKKKITMSPVYSSYYHLFKNKLQISFINMLYDHIIQFGMKIEGG
jgi:hypothetical protein